MPENTMAGFLKAVESGISTLHMDVVISKDGQIVVSHEPWISSQSCSHPGGKPVSLSEEKNLNIYLMTYAEIQQFDCGSRSSSEFSHQQKISAVKPTLKMAVRSVQRFAEENKYMPPKFNIELGSDPKFYTVYSPEPSTFAELVVSEIRRLGIEDIVILQSADPNILEELNKTEPREFKIGYVVEKGKNLKKNLARIHFIPDYYIAQHDLITKDLIDQCHAMKMKILAFPVNSSQDMDKILSWGIDGFISDYPDIAAGKMRLMK